MLQRRGCGCSWREPAPDGGAWGSGGGGGALRGVLKQAQAAPLVLLRTRRAHGALCGHGEAPNRTADGVVQWQS